MTEIIVNDEVRKQWVDALRSGKYEQGRDTLRKGNKFCCLGVLCDLAVKNEVIPEPMQEGDEHYYDGQWSGLPISVIRWAGMSEEFGSVNGMIEGYNAYAETGTIEIDGVRAGFLSDFNDRGLSFERIADLIEGKVDKPAEV